ncbi:Por secretion system C-terminal sorting domain-containing protein [Reichenbachiella faecimaris]|uniref:Por secretion system C-terminal sorting domain-containing protein n=1 Tax=Reichenbachiella faecimaris TaxID=692418 RepID=A0A1W2G8L6_REIFA|nr:cadherin domain-containing protein [Reichenbachiella faecimaris]SMD32782.1 Por secretion system C-terminal sorting domain-containing protein [Reichenbachiella faecimaris]
MTKQLRLLACILFGLSIRPFMVQAQTEPFITTWEFSSTDDFKLPCNDTESFDDTYDFQYSFDQIDESGQVIINVIDDGSHFTTEGDDLVISIPTPGRYRLQISGKFPRFFGYTKAQLLDVVQWGDIVWLSMNRSFSDWPGTGFSATDAPDLSQIETMEVMFGGAEFFNDDLNHWDVSHVKNMQGLFADATRFNSDISEWKVVSATNMRDMFIRASTFNQDISDWEVGLVENMQGMFVDADAFNQDISDWDVRNVQNLSFMFQRANAFNIDISSWELESATNMRGMFQDAISFNQNLGNLDVTSVGNMLAVFDGAAISRDNFSNTLIGWSNQEVQSDIVLGADGLIYCGAGDAINKLETLFNWIIEGAGELCNDFCSEAITVAVGQTVSGNTTFATNDAAVAPACGSNFVDETDEQGASVGVWYRIVGNGETIKLSTCDFADFDTSISVYAGSCSTGLDCLAGNDDDDECSGNRSTVKFNSLEGHEYYVLVDGYDSDSGEFDMTVSSQPTIPPPANDNCNEAEQLTVFAEVEGTPSSGTNANATIFTDYNDCDPYANINDVWYQFNSGSNVEVSITLELIDTDATGPLEAASYMQIEAYDECGGEGISICESDGTFSMVVEPNTDYYLQLWNEINSEGTFTILIKDGPNTAAGVSSTTVSLSRFALNGSEVERVSVDDEEDHDQLLSIVSGNDEGIFTIDENTGLITVTDESALQSSATTSFELTVQAADQGPGSLTSTGTVTIDIIDNEFPVIANQSTSLDENTINDTVAMQVIASDDDGIIFSIVDGNVNNAFAISGSGQITVNDETVLNFEEQSVFELQVKVQDDDANLPLASTAIVTITLNDMNEAPVLSIPLDINISGFLPNGSVIRTMTFQDQDAGQTHTFAITAGNDDGIFNIDAASGEITVVNSVALEALDNDTNITLVVAVTDDGTPELTGDTDVPMRVFKNAAPQIISAIFTIDENAANGTEVGIVDASDSDGDDISFSIVGGNGASIFSIRTDGQIQVIDESALDFETQSSFGLIVQATDDSQGSLSVEESITINLTNVNEAPIAQDMSLSMSAFVQNGYVLGTLLATDPENDELTFTIISGNANGVFAVDANTGVGTVADASLINVESTPKYELGIEVSDGSLSKIVTAEIFVFVNQFPSLLAKEFAIDENSPEGTVIAILSSDDSDGIGSFEILSVGEEGFLSLDFETGELSLASSQVLFRAAGAAGGSFSLDYESVQEIVLEVRITDEGIGSLQTVETVTISINDVNEFEPVISNVDINALDENAVAGTIAAIITSTDEDTFQTLSYMITAGNTGNAFRINNNGEIEVNTSSALDFETKSKFELTVVVSDNLNPVKTASTSVEINLTDVDEVVLSNATDVIGFVLTEQTGVASIDADALSIAIEVGSAANLSALSPTVTLSAGATSSPVSNAVVDFTNQVTYTVTAEDGTTQDWLVSVSQVADDEEEDKEDEEDEDEEEGEETVLGIEPMQDDWEIFPNPTRSVLHVKTTEKVKAYLIDLKGVRVTNESVGNDLEFDLNDLNPGTYLLMIRNEKGLSAEQIIKH